MEDFDILYDKMKFVIVSIISKLGVYKDHDHYFQTGLIYLWKAQKAYCPEKGSFETFAYYYIRGGILSELRKRHKIESRELQTDVIPYYSIPIDKDELRDYEIILKDQINGLSSKQKQFIYLHYHLGKKISEIANETGRSYSYVKKLKRDLLAQLRRKLLKD